MTVLVIFFAQLQCAIILQFLLIKRYSQILYSNPIYLEINILCLCNYKEIVTKLHWKLLSLNCCLFGYSYFTMLFHWIEMFKIYDFFDKFYRISLNLFIWSYFIELFIQMLEFPKWNQNKGKHSIRKSTTTINKRKKYMRKNQTKGNYHWKVIAVCLDV